jgi:hypothetical protein
VYRAMRGWRRSVAMLAMVALMLPACASSRAGSVRALHDAPSASPDVCATGDGDALRAGLLEAAALGTWLMLRGAAEGAWHGAVFGGVKDGTWIGAAVGLGVGALVGFAIGATTHEARPFPHRETCLVARAPATRAGLDLAERETLLPAD